jgi:glycosyltransferase involved in cell wall biosynthesis
MKNALLISYSFPPLATPGSLRWLRLIKDTAAYGWKISVITTSHSYNFGSFCDPNLLSYVPDSVPVYRSRSWEILSEYPAPLKIGDWEKINAIQASLGISKVVYRSRLKIKQILNQLTFQFFPDDKVGWVIPTYFKAISLLKKQDFDVIITSGMPHSSHLVGLLIKYTFPNVLWAAYFSDPWSFCEYARSPRWQIGRSHLEKKLEKKIFHTTDCNIVNTESTREEYIKLFPYISKKITTITNSFDPQLLEDITEEPRMRFRFQHIGRFFGQRSPRFILEAIKCMLQRNPIYSEKIEFIFTGNFGWDDQRKCWNRTYIDKYGLSSIVNIEPTVNHKDALKRLVNTDVLLLIGAPIESDYLYIPSKTYEYLATGKPILAMVNKHGDTAKLMKKFDCGRVVDVDDIDAISKGLEELYYSVSNGKYKVNPDNFLNSEYGPKRNAEKFFGVLSSLHDKKRTTNK